MLTVQSACARELSSVRLKNVDSAHNTNDSGWFIVPWFDAGFSSQNESASTNFSFCILSLSLKGQHFFQ